MPLSLIHICRVAAWAKDDDLLARRGRVPCRGRSCTRLPPLQPVGLQASGGHSHQMCIRDSASATQRIEGEGNTQISGEAAPCQSITGNNNIQIGAVQLVVQVVVNVQR